MSSSRTAVTRRRFLQTGALAAGSVVLAACGQAAPAAPAPPKSDAKPAQPVAPAAAPANPAEAAKPAAKAVSGQIVFSDGIPSHSELCYQWAERFSAQNSGVKVDV